MEKKARISARKTSIMPPMTKPQLQPFHSALHPAIISPTIIARSPINKIQYQIVLKAFILESFFKKGKKGEKKEKKRVIGKTQKLFGVKPSKPNAKPPTYIFEEQVTPQNTPQNSSSGENEKIPLIVGKKKAILIGLNYPSSY